MSKLYLVYSLAKNGRGWNIKGLYKNKPTTEIIGYVNWKMEEIESDLFISPLEGNTEVLTDSPLPLPTPTP